MKITELEVRLLDNHKRLCGSADIVLDDCLKIRDILVIRKESTGEYHITMPCKKIGKNYFVSLVHPINSELRQDIETAVMDEFYRLLETGKAESPLPEEEQPIGDEDDV